MDLENVLEDLNISEMVTVESEWVDAFDMCIIAGLIPILNDMILEIDTDELKDLIYDVVLDYADTCNHNKEMTEVIMEIKEKAESERI